MTFTPKRRRHMTQIMVVFVVSCISLAAFLSRREYRRVRVDPSPTRWSILDCPTSTTSQSLRPIHLKPTEPPLCPTTTKKTMNLQPTTSRQLLPWQVEIDMNWTEPLPSILQSCPSIYGTILVFVAVEAAAYSKKYGVAQRSLRCYLKDRDYSLAVVDLFNDTRE